MFLYSCQTFLIGFRAQTTFQEGAEQAEVVDLESAEVMDEEAEEEQLQLEDESEQSDNEDSQADSGKSPAPVGSPEPPAVKDKDWPSSLSPDSHPRDVPGLGIREEDYFRERSSGSDGPKGVELDEATELKIKELQKKIKDAKKEYTSKTLDRMQCDSSCFL